jgi:Ribbon-helix-helix protein
MPREQRTARLTVLIDPDKKAVFEHLCTLDDVTPSQIIRRLIRDFIEQHTGRPWQPGERPQHLRRPDTVRPSANKRARSR